MPKLPDPLAAYQPPAAALTPCPGCGVLVCTRVFVLATKHAAPEWRELAQPQSCITGTPHQCGEGQ